MISQFEQSFAARQGTRFGVATNSGAAAIHLALLAARVSPGDEVLLPAYGWGQALVFLDALDAKPVFAYVNDKLCLDPASVEERITEATKAVIVIHAGGMPADLVKLRELTAERGVFLIEDCCSALGAQYQGRNVGTWGDAAVFSFGPRKHLPCGEGGMLLTNNRITYEVALSAGSHPNRMALNGISSDPSYEQGELFWPSPARRWPSGLEQAGSSVAQPGACRYRPLAGGVQLCRRE